MEENKSMNFKDLNEEIKKKYLSSFAFCGVFFLFFVITGIFSKLHIEFLLFAGVVLLYAAYKLAELISLLRSNDILSVKGVCKQIKKPVYDLKIQTFYGEGKIYVEDEATGQQYIVPVSSNFEVTDNDIVTFLCRMPDMYFDGSFFVVVKPLSVKVLKVN